MENVIHTFSPESGEQMLYFIGGLAIFALCLVLFWLSLKKNWRLLLLFSGFIGFVALGTSVFSYLTQERFGDVMITEQGIIFPSGEVPFSNIRMVKIDISEEFSRFPIQQDGKMLVLKSTRLFLLEEVSGKVHLLSELNYPVDTIYDRLDAASLAWREEQEN